MKEPSKSVKTVINTSFTVDGTVAKSATGIAQYDLDTRICTFSLTVKIGTYSTSVSHIIASGLPNPKGSYTFPCFCTDHGRTNARILCTDVTAYNMRFLPQTPTPDYINDDTVVISGSYIIDDSVTS